MVANKTTGEYDGVNPFQSPHNYKETFESSVSYDYSAGYLNHTDFSNAAVLNELNMYAFIPVNEKYIHLPNKITSSYTYRDENGNVINTQNYTVNSVYTYGSQGWVATRTPDMNFPGEVTTFVY